MNQTVTYEGYTPFDYQNQVHNAITEHIETIPRFTNEFKKVFCVKAKRQVGKTMMVENELTRFAIDFSDSLNWFVAPSFNLAKKVYKDLNKAYLDADILDYANISDLVIRLKNKSEIHCKSAEQKDNLRGESITGLLCIDEGAFIRDYVYYSVLKPMTNFHKAVTLITSTPKFLNGFFSELYHKGIEGDNDIYSFDFCNFDTSHVLTDTELKNLESILDPITFRNEYLGLFANAESHVFGNFKKNILSDSFDNKYIYLYGGLDFATGSGQDETSLCLLNEKGQQVFRKTWKTTDPVKQVEEICSFLRPLRDNLRGLLVELNGIGKVYFSMLQNQLKQDKITILGFNTTNESKRQLVEETNQSFGLMQLYIMNDQQQIDELQFYQSKLNKVTNTVSYQAATGYHDDDVISLMLANRARKMFQGTGKNYSFIINK